MGSGNSICSPIISSVNMHPTGKISAKAFLHERVKNKILFHGTESYPVHIRITVGARSLSFKSFLFYHLRSEKYTNAKFSVDDVLAAETECLTWLVQQESAAVTPEQLRERYLHFSTDLLAVADRKFWQFLVDFFSSEALPAYVDFLKSHADVYTSSMLLNNLERSLHPDVFKRLLDLAVTNAPPYIPLAGFFAAELSGLLPVLPLWRWESDKTQEAFQQYVASQYPSYLPSKPVQLINRMVESRGVQAF